MYRTLLTFSLLAAPSLALADGHSATTEAGLDGSWASIACEVRPQPNQDGTMGEWWLTRSLSIETGRIEADFTTYAGPGCTVPLNLLSFAGQVDVLGPSDVLEGAVEADLTIDEFVRITPLAQGFADFLNSGSACGGGGWTLNEAQDIQESGCDMLGIAPGQVTVEYEILAAQGDMIYFGARPTDGTFITTPEKRPRALLVPAMREN